MCEGDRPFSQHAGKSLSPQAPSLLSPACSPGKVTINPVINDNEPTWRQARDGMGRDGDSHFAFVFSRSRRRAWRAGVSLGGFVTAQTR
jgi:hypothetical protein